MNIFYLDQDAVTCAQYHNNKHVVKMILESCQLLCTAHRVTDGIPYEDRTKNNRRITRYILPDGGLDRILYQATHINHPCAVWCRQSISNYIWLWRLTDALAQEYTYRYGKVHKCERDGLIEQLKFTPIHLPLAGWTEPAQAMPDHCKHPDAVEAYRNYYRQEKQHLAKWTKREIPEWFLQKELVCHSLT